jgi:hypothetical protein
VFLLYRYGFGTSEQVKPIAKDDNADGVLVGASAG